MATINCTNQKAAPAFKNQSVWIALNGAESLSVLPVLVEGQLATIGSNSVTGHIDFVDTYGHSFRVAPIQPDKQFSSGAGATITNTLNSAELITISY